MKKTVRLFLLFPILLWSCKKDKGIRTLEKDLIGTWEMVSTDDHLGYRQYQLGRGYNTEYQTKNVVRRREGNILVFSGKYSLVRKADCQSRVSDIYLTTNESSSVPYYVEMKNDTLYMSKPNCNGVYSVSAYRRL
ncbi:MAG: hypothetical protein KA160_02335 [Lacibacter sp.]|nr:hypothetical protein [Lacibacter sp.]